MAVDWTKRQPFLPYKREDGSFAVVIPLDYGESGFSAAQTDGKRAEALEFGMRFIGEFYGKDAEGQQFLSALPVGATPEQLTNFFTTTAEQGMSVSQPRASLRGKSIALYEASITKESLDSFKDDVLPTIITATSEGKKVEDVVSWSNIQELHNDLATVAHNLRNFQEDLEELDFLYFNDEYGILDLDSLADQMLDLRDEIVEYFININKASGTDEVLIGFIETQLDGQATDLLIKFVSTQDTMLWQGFASDLLPNYGFIFRYPQDDPRIKYLLYKSKQFLKEPGVIPAPETGKCTGHKEKNSNPSGKTESTELLLDRLIDKYIFPTPIIELPAIGQEPPTEESAADFRDKKAKEGSKPKTLQEAQSDETIWKNSTLKSVLANKNKKSSSYARDAIWQAMPKNPDKIRSVQDAYAHVLNRLSLPQLSQEVIRCLSLDLSVDDIINTMCDTLLKSVSLDPSAIDELFLVLESEIQIANIPLVNAEEKQQLINNLKQRYAQFVIDGVEDPFYKALVQDEILYNTRDGKQFICELIVGSAYRLGQFISSLNPDGDLFGPYEEKDIPAIEYCNYDFDFSKRITPYASRLGKTISQQVEAKAMEALESLIVVPLQQAIVTLTESCKPPYNFGVVSFDNVGTAQAHQFLEKEGVFDPPLFFDNLSANLSASELCELLNGRPTRLTLYEASLFLQTEFPELYTKINNFSKIKSFFADFGKQADLSFCDELADEIQQQPLLGPCFGEETDRQTALKDRLFEKGLSEVQIDEQFNLDKETKKKMISDAVKTAMNNGASLDFNLGQAIAEDPSMVEKSALMFSSSLGIIEKTFNSDIEQYVPLVSEDSDVFESFKKDVMGAGETNVFPTYYSIDNSVKNRLITHNQNKDRWFVFRIADDGRNLFAVYEQGDQELLVDFPEPEGETGPGPVLYNNLGVALEALPLGGNVDINPVAWMATTFSDENWKYKTFSNGSLDTSQTGEGQAWTTLDDPTDPTLSDYIYDKMALNFIRRFLVKTVHSPLLDKETFDKLKVEGIFDLKQLALEGATTFLQKIQDEDLESNTSEMTSYNESMKETMALALLKIYITEYILKAIFGTAEFPVKASFSDRLFIEFIVERIEQEDEKILEIIQTISQNENSTVQSVVEESVDSVLNGLQEVMNGIVNKAVPAQNAIDFKEDDTPDFETWDVPDYKTTNYYQKNNQTFAELIYSKEPAKQFVGIDEEGNPSFYTDGIILETYLKFGYKSEQEYDEQNADAGELSDGYGQIKEQIYNYDENKLGYPDTEIETDDEEVLSRKKSNSLFENFGGETDTVQEEVIGWIGDYEFELKRNKEFDLKKITDNVQYGAEFFKNFDSLSDDKTIFNTKGKHTVSVTLEDLGLDEETLEGTETEKYVLVQTDIPNTPAIFDRKFTSNLESSEQELYQEGAYSWFVPPIFGESYKTVTVTEVRKVTTIKKEQSDFSEFTSVNNQVNWILRGSYENVFNSVSAGVRLSYVTIAPSLDHDRLSAITTPPANSNFEKSKKLKKAYDNGKGVITIPIVESEKEFDKETSIVDILSQYPSSEFNTETPGGKGTYDELFGQLTESTGYKSYFERILPINRMLAISSIYSIYQFENSFEDPEEFEELFSTTKTLLADSIKNLEKE